MAIQTSRLFGPYDPIKDFHDGQETLILEGAFSREDIRAAIIESNLKATDPLVSSLGRTESIPRPFSKWEICKVAMNDRICTAKIITTIALFALGIYFGKWSVSSLINYYNKYTQGHLIQIYYRGIPQPVRPLRFDDIIAWGVVLAMRNITYSLFYLLPMLNAWYTLQDRLALEPPETVLIAKLIKQPSSGASLTDPVEDCFSHCALSVSEAKRPKNLTVGQYTGDLWYMIHSILSKNLSKAHPIEDRSMTAEEATKFDTDIQNCLGIPSLHSLWSLQPENREKEFLDLLPQPIQAQYNLAKKKFAST